MIKLTWSDFKKSCKFLAEKIPAHTFKNVYGIPTGGCFVAQELARLFNFVVVDTPEDHTLVVDDIVHSGKTISEFEGYQTASLFVRKDQNKVHPSYYVDEVEDWINFPWEHKGLEVETIEQNVTRILEAIGENPNRPGLVDTPKRIARMYKEVFKGYDVKLKPDLTAFVNNTDGIQYDQMMVDWGRFNSWCEHHMLSFRGKFFIGYIPNEKVFGLSKFSRIVDYFASKLQIQERLVKEIADELEAVLNPKGLGVTLIASHLCKEVRGVKNEGAFTTTDLRGVFREQKVKEEFFMVVNRHI